MRNDINAIKNEIVEQTNEKKQREIERKQAKQYADFKELCRSLINLSIFNSIKNGATLNEIYKQRNYIINAILQDIKSKTTEIENPKGWIGETITTRLYPFPDYQIIDILGLAFDSEYLKAEKRQKKEHLILKQELKEQLKNKLKEIIENETPKDCNYQSMIKALMIEHNKNDVINEITQNEAEQNELDNFYYQTLNEIKRGYQEIPQRKTTPKKIKLALPWKILASYKAIGKLWKM